MLAFDPTLGLEGAQDIGDAGARDPGAIGKFAWCERAAGEQKGAHDGHLAAQSLVCKARNALMKAAKLDEELAPKLMEIGIFHRKPLTLETIFGGR